MPEGLGLGRGTAGPQGRGWQGLGKGPELGQGWREAVLGLQITWDSSDDCKPQGVPSVHFTRKSGMTEWRL